MGTEERTSTTAACLISLCSLMLVGCFSLGRVEPIQQQYVLGASRSVESEGQRAGLAGITIGVRRLQLAPYLDPPFLVVRQGSHEIHYSEFQRWAERLDVGINRAVAGYLSVRAQFRAVDVAPWPAGEAYDYLIQLHVDRFEGLTSNDTTTVSGEAYVLATWEIIRQEDETVLARGRTDYRRPGWRVGDHRGLVSLLDGGLDVLSADIAASLEELAASKASGGGARRPPGADVMLPNDVR